MVLTATKTMSMSFSHSSEEKLGRDVPAIIEFMNIIVKEAGGFQGTLQTAQNSQVKEFTNERNMTTNLLP